MFFVNALHDGNSRVPPERNPPCRTSSTLMAGLYCNSIGTE
jgi:hypothetical protein